MRVLYIRVSTEAQPIERFMRKGFDRIYVDRCSGSIPMISRKEGSKLMKEARKGSIESVTAQSINMIARNEFYAMGILYLLEAFNVNLIEGAG